MGLSVFDREMNTCIWSHAYMKQRKGGSAKCCIVANNVNKNTSAEKLQPKWQVDSRPPKKPIGFIAWALQACKRATVTRPNRPNKNATEPEQVARTAHFNGPNGPFGILIKLHRDVKKTQATERQGIRCFAEIRVQAAAESLPENIASTRRETGQIVLHL